MILQDTHIEPDYKRLAEEIGLAMADQLWARLSKGNTPLAPEYLSPRQASQLTGIPIKTLEAMRGKREGPPYYKQGRRVFYKAKDLRDYMESLGPVE